MTDTTLAYAREVLRRNFGYPDFRHVQRQAVEAVLSGRDAVIVLPTGGGKSICFQVPALCHDRLTVVVSPLISLMADQVQALERRGISATYLNSTLSPDEASARVTRLRRGEVRLLYVAPERLVTGSTTKLLSDVGVDLLAIDEAHCVSEWGEDFRPSYLQLASVRRKIGDPQTVALTATATPRVRRDITRLLGLRDPRVVVGGFDRPNLRFRVERVESDAARYQAMVKHLKGLRDPAVVYTATRRQVETVSRILSSGGVNAVAYHAGLATERRSRAQDAFMNGSRRVIVATNAFGMGIDKPDVRLVLHFLHSGSLEDYYQEAGRAGRDGTPSNCLLLFHEHDRRVHDRMREQRKVAGELLRRVWQCLAGLSNGRRAVPLDAALIAARHRRGASVESVERALSILVDRGIVSDVSRPDRMRLRLLASPLRVECERSALSRDAVVVLDLLVRLPHGPDEWRSLTVADTGLTAPRLETVLLELESRQLVFVDRVAARGILGADSSTRARLERLIHQLETRREVERAKLASIVSYATALMCRRRFILSYFGDRSGGSAACGGCDVCAPSK